MGSLCGIEYECLPLGGGDVLRVFPDGAYVPNAWIDQATDSVGGWRAGSERERNCVLRVSSLNVELQDTRQSVRAEKDHGLSLKADLDGCEKTTNDQHATITMLSTRVKRRGNMVLVLSLTTALLLTTTALLSLPSP